MPCVFWFSERKYKDYFSENEMKNLFDLKNECKVRRLNQPHASFTTQTLPPHTPQTPPKPS
jgi:hypothetical protein